MFDKDLRNLAYIPRWSLLRHIRQQSVAEHSFYVAIYAGQIAHAMGWPGDRAALLDAALTHDLDELVTADIPGPVKRAYRSRMGIDGLSSLGQWMRSEASKRVPDLPDDPDRETKFIVALADMIEACVYLEEEKNLGNRNVQDYVVYMHEQTRELIERCPAKFAPFKDMFLEFLKMAVEKETIGTIEAIRHP